MEKEIIKKLHKQVLLSDRMMLNARIITKVERSLRVIDAMMKFRFLLYLFHIKMMETKQKNQLLIAIKILHKDGVKTIWDLKKLTPEEILKHKGIGKRRLALIEELINSY